MGWCTVTELGAVGKRGFDLHVRNHLGNAIHHVIARQDRWRQ